MKQHLLRISTGVVEFGKLVAAVRHEGLRVGRLRWHPAASEAPSPLPDDLAEAADHGVLRAVAVTEKRVVSVKPLRGPAVLRDVLREHFRGCALVLVEGDIEAPSLSPEDDGWRIAEGDEVLWRGAAEQLATRLRRPRPWMSESTSV